MNETFIYQSIINELRFKPFFNFVKYYLCRRYEGLVNVGDTIYASTEEFVDNMLNNLLARGITNTRKLFFNDLTKKYFNRLYDNIKPRIFDFDAKVLLPFVSYLPSDSSVLDLGAGNNHFLPVIADRAGRHDIRYFATDYYVQQTTPMLNREPVIFITQPEPYVLPENMFFDIILMRRVAHHVHDFPILVAEIKRHLSPGGLIILIEDTYDDRNSPIHPEMSCMADHELTEAFNNKLNRKEKITFLKFNDFYSNYIYHNWLSMPLPLNHNSFSGWEYLLNSLNLFVVIKVNMGFPRNIYNLHQAATGVICCNTSNSEINIDLYSQRPKL